ncbi:MAG TPA: ankyrin repeat domain-containing protein [Candidatus Dependentiae bacterium]|jgi:hypothetical protein|nr:ankyrin repeat domain-containing protein [Candidatus Dependentiae bacterium]
MNYFKYGIMCLIMSGTISAYGMGAFAAEAAGIILEEPLRETGRGISHIIKEIGSGTAQAVRDEFRRRRHGDQFVAIEDEVEHRHTQERERLELEVAARMPTRGQIMVSMLHDAVREQNHEKVDGLLKQGVNVDCVVRRNVTPLMIVSALGHTGIMHSLITMHANVNAQDVDGLTPLFYASGNNRVGAVTLLLDCLARISRARDGSLPSNHTHSGQIARMLEGPEERFTRTEGSDAARGTERRHASPAAHDDDEDSSDEGMPLERKHRTQRSTDDEIQTKKSKS